MMNENANQNLFRLKEKEFQQKISATTASTAEATTSTISSSSASASKKRKTVRPIAMSECNFVDVRRPNNDATIVTELPPITYKSSIFTTTTTSQARTVRRYALNKHPGLTIFYFNSQQNKNRAVCFYSQNKTKTLLFRFDCIGKCIVARTAAAFGIAVVERVERAAEHDESHRAIRQTREAVQRNDARAKTAAREASLDDARLSVRLDESSVQRRCIRANAERARNARS